MSKYSSVDVVWSDEGGEPHITEGLVDMRAALTLKSLATIDDINIYGAHDWSTVSLLIRDDVSLEQALRAIALIQRRLEDAMQRQVGG